MITPQRTTSGRIRLVLSVHNHKGGVGKTTISREIATYFALAGLSVLLVDGDQQGTATHSVRLRRSGGLKRLVLNDVEYGSVLKSVPETFTGMPGLDYVVLPSNSTTKEIENHALTVESLYQAVADLRQAFDLIVADMAPSIDDIHSAFFYASDYILIPTINSAYSIAAVGDTLSAMRKHADEGKEYGLQVGEVLGILPTIFETDTAIKRRLRAKFYKQYKGAVPIFPEMRKLDIWEAAADTRQSIWTMTSNNPFEMEAIKRARADMMPLINAILSAMEAVA